jgi:transcriptional regulator NrdR family protein
VETRDADEAIRRRRVCDTCGLRFTTYERPELTRLTVHSATGAERSVTRAWLAGALRAAAPALPDDTLQAIAARVEAELRAGVRQRIGTADVAALATPLLQLEVLRAQGAPARPSPDLVETALDASLPPPRRAPGPEQLALPLT